MAPGRRIGGAIEIPRLHGRWPVPPLSGSITLRDLDTDPVVRSRTRIQHLDFAQLLGASGLAVPESLGMGAGAGRDLGSATIDVRVRGRLADPASLSVSQKIDFSRHVRCRRQSRACAAISSSDPKTAPGRTAPSTSRSRPPTSSPCATFRRCSCALCCLPKTQAFTGIAASTLRELPAALLTNWSAAGERAPSALGASTITQQLPRTCPVARQAARTQAAGTGDHVPARVGARQESYPRRSI